MFLRCHPPPPCSHSKHPSPPPPSQCRDLAMRVKVPASLRQELTSLLESSDMGALADTDARWAEAEEALKRVWASKFNERACVR